MRDLDDLVNSVRSPESREHLLDAVRAYQGGALRSAIISTWVAVALDIVGKLQELADAGDAAATAFIAARDKAIASADVRKLGEIESSLLAVARDDFELLTDRESVELARLQSDRHICAHPAFVEPDQVFKPTPELCRAHIAAAVDSVLAHGPTAGRKTLDRFIAEAQSHSWPGTVEALAAHLRASYSDRGKSSLRRNLAIVIVKGCLDGVTGVDPVIEPTVRARLAQAAHALDLVDPSELAAAMNQYVGRREEMSGLSDQQLLRGIGALGDMSPFWFALPLTSHPRAEAVIQSAPLELLQDAGALRGGVVNHQVAGHIQQRIDVLDVNHLTIAIGRAPSKAFVTAALREFNLSGGWRTAESRMAGLVLPLAQHLDLAELEQVLEAVRSNDQVREASAMPSLVDALFMATVEMPGALPFWNRLSVDLQSKAGGPLEYYAYPTLANRVREKMGL